MSGRAAGLALAVVMVVGAGAWAQGTASPVCVRVGTRSEGWAWPDGRFIRWAKCKGVVPTCKAGKEGEGWYDRSGLIANETCRPAKRTRAQLHVR